MKFLGILHAKNVIDNVLHVTIILITAFNAENIESEKIVTAVLDIMTME
jgi:hypothetical protein